jgi:hypothetical protein
VQDKKLEISQQGFDAISSKALPSKGHFGVLFLIFCPVISKFATKAVSFFLQEVKIKIWRKAPDLYL